MRYYELNNEVMQRDANGTLQFDKDKEATRAYFLDYVNKNTVFFHSLREKLDYLIENDYYERELFDQYTFDEIKAVYKYAYAFKFRFPSFMAAYKFYEDYALRTNDKERILERYEDRVAVNALFFAKGDGAKALEYVDSIMFDYQPATPTFMNIGRKRRGELVSCFQTEVGDSLNDINMAESTAKQLSKMGGGVSLNLSNLRAKGEAIKDIANVGKGVVGVMKMLDHGFRYANQLGQRNGSGAVYLNVFHADIFDFLETKKISADEDVRAKTLNIGVVIPDKFMQLARDNKPMYLFYPHTIYQAYGKRFADINITEMYDELVANPKVRKDKISARLLQEKISALKFESGYPYEMYEDRVNDAHPLSGKVKMSNLCTEILQQTTQSTFHDYEERDKDEIGLGVSCNLGSLDIKNTMNRKTLSTAVPLAVDALTVVSDATSVVNAPDIRRANEEMHSIGLGAMNLHGYLTSVGIVFESALAIEFADVYFAAVNYYSIKRSMEIAKERGETFVGFADSTYADGSYFADYIANEQLPKDAYITELFEGQSLPTTQDWAELMADVMQYGLYNAYRLAIAPNGSTSYLRSATSGVMPIMERIEERTYEDSKTYYPMPGLSTKTWFYYKEAYDMDMFKVIDLVATIQKHVDQGISFTLFLRDTMTTRDVSRMSLYAHHKGIKTLYYARTKDTSADMCIACQV
ncbi:putative ribonucleotide-diphosphate reductase subunit alpha [uncultured Caudovirales phage]|uniref:Ribonucleoside-diphosphate reductase n=1 Tax=uncultured Caudovirales phage TaxID=2100421 RepID=A0A2H4J164_9CAUD|nr:putative ribonucleotide-diphosphate reductase subunit alpha [uncultured Caudovirales phage]